MEKAFITLPAGFRLEVAHTFKPSTLPREFQDGQGDILLKQKTTFKWLKGNFISPQTRDKMFFKEKKVEVMKSGSRNTF